MLSLYSSILYGTTWWFSSLTAVLLNIVFVWLGVIWLILPVFDRLGHKLCQHTTILCEVANVCKEQMPPCEPWHAGTPHVLKNYVCAHWNYCICQKHLSRKWKYITGIQNMLKRLIHTSQESFCPLAYPAQRKLLRITLECPAVWNISWHTPFSITGTWTSWSRLGTPPPGKKSKTPLYCFPSLSTG